MRITAVHSVYSSDSVSGENLAVGLQTRALAEAGHDIDLLVRETDELSRRRTYPVASALRVMTGRDFGGQELPFPESTAHTLLLHNLFPNFGTSWVKAWPGPVVTVLHNYRYVCANGLLLRDGQPCDLCLDGSSWPAVQHRCYRDSRSASLPLAIGNRPPVSRVVPLSRADLLITQTERSRDLYQRAGVEADALRFIPGFTETETSALQEGHKPTWAFIGRLTSEKGLDGLLRLWPDGECLEVIGSGEDEGRLRGMAHDNTVFVGALSHDEVLGRLGAYRGLVFPGICWEGAHPMVVREALALGVPVVAAEGSAAADVISSHGGGTTYQSCDRQSLLHALQVVEDAGAEMREQARSTAQEMFSKRVWQSRMASALNDASVRHRARQN